MQHDHNTLQHEDAVKEMFAALRLVRQLERNILEMLDDMTNPYQEAPPDRPERDLSRVSPQYDSLTIVSHQ